MKITHIEDPTHEALKWTVRTVVRKWDEEDAWIAGAQPNELIVVDGNIVTTTGITRLWNLFIGAVSGAGNDFRNGYARLGVGDGTTAATSSDADLSAATNKFWKGVDAGYPSVATNTLSLQTTFQTGEANFAWNEWGTDNGGGGTGATGTTTSGVFLNHRVPATSLGTKTSGVWALAVTIALS